MMLRSPRRLAVLALITLIWASMASALAAANTVPPSRASDTTRPITANDLKPPECAGITLTAKVVGSGTFSGTGASELIVGGPGADNITANGGSDCVLGGGGDDILRGSGGNDVILGGPGNDDIRGGTGTDVCYGGGQAGDIFSSCETIIP